MSRLSKTCGLSLLSFAFVLMLSAVGFSLLYAQPASAASYTITKYYTVYKKTKSGTDYYLYYYYNGTDNKFEIIDWAPQIKATSDNCDTRSTGWVNFDTKKTFWNCKTLDIEGKPGRSQDWFNKAYYSYIVGDVDWEETVTVGGGNISDSDHGSSTNNPTDGGQKIQATTTHCDKPNPNRTNRCSVLIKFNHTFVDAHASDFFSIKFWGNSSGHEYWYDGIYKEPYQTLTFDPNGGSVTDDKVDPSDGTIGDEATIWSHPDGVNVSREYKRNAKANEYPRPTNGVNVFQGWYTAKSGGIKVTWRIMGNDETLYAHWSSVPDGWALTPESYVAMITDSDSPGGSDTGNRDIATPGNKITWAHTVTNDGPLNTNAAVSSNYRNSQGLQPNGDGPPPNYDIPSGFTADSAYEYESSYVVSNGDVGQTLCRSTWAVPHSSSDSHEVESLPDCVLIIDGKKPKAQIWGGDLIVGRGFDGSPSLPSNVITSRSIKDSNTFGSWVEYAIYAPGTISGAASASALAGGLSGGTFDQYNYLSFVNTDNRPECDSDPGVPVDSNVIGCYTFAGHVPNIKDSFPNSNMQSKGFLSGSVNLSDSSIASGTYTASGDITLTLSELPSSGKSIAIKAVGYNVTITENQTYANGSYSKVSDLPHLIIIADNIDIADSVTQIDAWLIATDSINTCSTVPLADPLSTSKCDQPLVVNGPVMTNKLFLRRTYGSEASTPGEPAEVFNLRPDAYLWAYSQAARSGKAQTTYQTELPPRF